MLSIQRLALPPAGLAIKVVLTILVFILIIEIFSSSHPISERILPASRSGPQLITHGNNRCLPRADETLNTYALQLRQSCAAYSPHEPATGRIGVVTAQFGAVEESYGRAFQSHHLHSMVHSTELHVMCESMIDDLWNKPAFLLALLLDEMLKPEHTRLDWIFWVDRDTIILDQCRPVSSYLPPKTKADGSKPNIETHLMVANDWNGMNNGVFAMRVNHWSINLLMDILAFRDFMPEVELRFTEQSAMELVIMKEPKFRRHVQMVPQEWFNTYPQGDAIEFEQRTNDTGLQRFQARRGDFLVHFAGSPDKGEQIDRWMDMLRRMGNIWERKDEEGWIQRDISGDIKRFWETLEADESRISD